MNGRLLVTGGAGYVGSHCGRLVRAGFNVTVFDDLSQGHREAVDGPLVVADIRDREALGAALEGVDAVLHFAARVAVGESQRDPIGYWDVNVGGAAALLAAMVQAGVRRLVVSSTCAVHGAATARPIAEDAPIAPTSPYGETKAAMERMVVAAEAAGQIEAIRLRYFNAAGAAPDGWLGEAHHPETHLIPLALAAAAGGPAVRLFGDAHPTPDGTCIRDYVHVEDLADAHLAAARRLMAGGSRAVFNLGTGRGASVREVFAAVERVLGPVPQVVAPPRAGDPPLLVADPAASHRGLDWRATRDLDAIVADAWRWQRAPRFGRRAA
ncbi:MAG: UDP-glucose 4-epimerase GalE, partial [Myxococcales bacterium]|nr:UDP-glucose 4-epimerase GalE [Myxococcales bacterium]